MDGPAKRRVAVDSRCTSGRGEAWYRARFGAERSPVRIRPPRLPSRTANIRECGESPRKCLGRRGRYSRWFGDVRGDWDRGGTASVGEMDRRKDRKDSSERTRRRRTAEGLRRQRANGGLRSTPRHSRQAICSVRAAGSGSCCRGIAQDLTAHEADNCLFTRHFARINGAGSGGDVEAAGGVFNAD